MGDPASGLVERDQAVDAIDRLLAGLRQGRGGTLFIAGGPGLGKTSCLEHARLRARGPGPGSGPEQASDQGPLQICEARGDPMRTGVPFGVLSQLLRGLGATSLLPSPARRRVPADAFVLQPYRVVRWFEEEQRSGPVLLAIDDLHWADTDSLAVLAFLWRRVGHLPLGTVATLRSWPPEAEDIVLRLVEGGGGRLQRLHPLTEAGVGTLLAARERELLPPEVVRRAASVTGGNPLLLQQLVAGGVTLEGGVAAAEDRAGTSDLAGAAAAGAPAGVAAGEAAAGSAAASLLRSRFAWMPPLAMRLAQAGSLFGNCFRPDVAAEIAELSGDDEAVAIEALCRGGLIRPAGGGGDPIRPGGATALGRPAGEGLVEFTHPLFRQAVYDDLSAPVRERLHSRGFSALRRRGLGLEAAAHAVSARLVGDGEAVRTLREAAEEAATVGAVATASEHLEAAVELAGRGVGAELRLALGEALLSAGRAAEAIAVYEAALGAGELEGVDRLRGLRMLGRALHSSGDRERAEARLSEAEVAAASGHAGDELARALLDHSRVAWLSRGPRAALPIARRAREVAAAGGPVLVRRASVAWGLISFLSGDPEGFGVLCEARRAAESDPRGDLDLSAWSWGSLRNLGRAAKYAERFDLAREAVDAALAAAEQHGDAQSVASLAAHQADTLLRLGRLREALALTLRARSVADAAVMAQPFAEVAEAQVLLLLGRRQEAETLMAAAEESAERTGQWLPRLRLWHLRGQCLLRDGRPAEAAAAYSRIETSMDELGLTEACLVPWGRHAALAHQLSGDGAAALRVIRWLESSASRLGCRWPAAVAGAARASLADAAGDEVAAERDLRSALARLDEVPLALERLQVLIELGSFLRRRGRPAESRQALTSALHSADEMGAAWLAEEACEELVAAGGRPRRPPPDPDLLTPQEERVAQLAAAGIGSEQIARRLLISAASVDAHLLRAYGKLRIHSRRQLMNRAAELDRRAGTGGS